MEGEVGGRVGGKGGEEIRFDYHADIVRKGAGDGAWDRDQAVD